MSSFPLTVWNTFRGEQGEVANAEEYQPLANDPGAPEPPEPAQMGADEQIPKPETRKGDLPAEWAAYVSLDAIFPPRMVPIFPRYLPQYVPQVVTSHGRVAVDRGLNRYSLPQPG